MVSSNDVERQTCEVLRTLGIPAIRSTSPLGFHPIPQLWRSTQELRIVGKFLKLCAQIARCFLYGMAACAHDGIRTRKHAYGLPFGLTTLGSQVLRRYAGVGGVSRLFLGARWRWTPYQQIASYIPTHGNILDLGCGHGLLSLAMGLSEPTRTILPIDHEPWRVAIAQKAASDLVNITVETGSLLDIVAAEYWHGTVAGIVIIDAIHYLPPDEQVAFLVHARKALMPGGVLLIRDVDAGAGKTFFINRRYEKMMTGLGFTMAKDLHFRSQAEWLTLLEDAGFDCTTEPCCRFPFADCLFVCRLRAAQTALAA